MRPRQENEMTNHDYSPSTTPSVDGAGCLHRERLADGTYSRKVCRFPERMHGRVSLKAAARFLGVEVVR